MDQWHQLPLVAQRKKAHCDLPKGLITQIRVQKDKIRGSFVAAYVACFKLQILDNVITAYQTLLCMRSQSDFNYNSGVQFSYCKIIYKRGKKHLREGFLYIVYLVIIFQFQVLRNEISFRTGYPKNSLVDMPTSNFLAVRSAP